MRTGQQMLREYRHFLALALLALLGLLHTPASQAAGCTTTVETTTIGSLIRIHTLADCGDQSTAQAECFDFVSDLGYSTGYCNLGGYPGYAGQYSAGWLQVDNLTSQFGNFIFCNTEFPSYYWAQDTLFIRRWQTTGSQCVAPPPERVEPQSPCPPCVHQDGTGPDGGLWYGQHFVDTQVAIIDGKDRGVYEQQSAVHG